MDIPYKQEILRKLIHLSSLWIVVAIAYFPKEWLLVLFAFLFILNVFVEYGYYKKKPFFVLVYGKLFGKILRSKETDGRFHLSGSPYVLASALCGILFFEPSVAMTALSVMLIGDTVAALVGRKIGRHKINRGTKSIEGSIAFLIASCAVLVFFNHLYGLDLKMGIFGIVVAMLAEIYEKQIKIDDNLSIVLCVGFFLSL